MKIAVFNGSPRKENTAALVEAFREGAESAGHEVNVYHVGQMKIAGHTDDLLVNGESRTTNDTCLRGYQIEQPMPETNSLLHPHLVHRHHRCTVE